MYPHEFCKKIKILVEINKYYKNYNYHGKGRRFLNDKLFENICIKTFAQYHEKIEIQKIDMFLEYVCIFFFLFALFLKGQCDPLCQNTNALQPLISITC